jgi:uncharacterized repeat protein (TIGR01451 family)
MGAASVFAESAFAEGGYEFNSNTLITNVLSQKQTALYYSVAATPAESTGYTVFRVYARAGETLQMGTDQMWKSNTASIQVFAPGTSFSANGAMLPLNAPVFDQALFDCRKSAKSPTGLVTTSAQEKAGPLPAAGGYKPCEFTVPADGIYPVIFQRAGGAVSYWDITVRDSSGTVHPGRVFSHVFRLIAGAVSLQLKLPPVRVYVLTPSDYVYRARLVNFHGEVWDLTAGDRGVVDAKTGERLFSSFQWGNDATRADNTVGFYDATVPAVSGIDETNDARYPLFVNPPDPLVVSGPGGLAEARGYETSPLKPSEALTSLKLTGTGGVTNGTLDGQGGTFSFSSPPPMNGRDYALEIDTDRNGSYDDAADVRHEGGQLSSSGNSFTWDGKDATGKALACNSYRWRVRSSLAELHLTQNDVEDADGIEIERLTLPDDTSLGDPFAASYNDIDPFKNKAITDANPATATDLRSGPTFHAWPNGTGNADYVDTWARLPEFAASNTFETCLTNVLLPGQNPLPPAKPLPTPPMVAPKPQPTRAVQSSANARLVVRKSVNKQRVRAGHAATFTIKVRNPTKKALKNVRVCDNVPSGVVAAGSKPKATTSKGRQCWTIKRLAAGKTATLRLTVRTLAGSRGRKSGRVTASATGVRSGRADAGFLVYGPPVAGGGVTG